MRYIYPELMIQRFEISSRLLHAAGLSRPCERFPGDDEGGGCRGS
jgi:hypothetical protein